LLLIGEFYSTALHLLLSVHSGATTTSKILLALCSHYWRRRIRMHIVMTSSQSVTSVSNITKLADNYCTIFRLTFRASGYWQTYTSGNFIHTHWSRKTVRRRRQKCPCASLNITARRGVSNSVSYILNLGQLHVRVALLHWKIARYPFDRSLSGSVSQSHGVASGQPPSPSWCRAPSGAHDQIPEFNSEIFNLNFALRPLWRVERSAHCDVSQSLSVSALTIYICTYIYIGWSEF
jgi:hypothetical protein